MTFEMDVYSHTMPKLVINPIGGLANRMRAIAGGVSLVWA